MAINSNPGTGERVFAEAPAIPSNVGKLDVGAIYDQVAKGLARSEGIGTAVRQGLAGAADTSTDVQKQAAVRSLIPAQTTEAQAQAAAGTAEAQAAGSKASFLAGLSGPQRLLADSGQGLGQTVHTSRVFDTSDPKNPRVVDIQDTYLSDPNNANAAPVKVKSERTESFAPRDVNVFKEHTDVNGNIITTTGTYRQLDLSKPAFQIDKEGNLSPILGPDGQPVNAALIGGAGKAERGTPVTSGVSGDAARIANFERIISDHPDTAADLQPVIDSLKANIDATNARTNAGATDRGDPGAQLIAKIKDIKGDIAQAAVADDPKVRAQVPVLQGTLDLYNQRLQALNAPKGKPAHAGLSLSTYTAPGTAAAAPAFQPSATRSTVTTNEPAAGTPITDLPDTAAYQSFAGGYYRDPNGVVGYKKPVAAPAAAAPVEVAAPETPGQ